MSTIHQVRAKLHEAEVRIAELEAVIAALKEVKRPTVYTWPNR